MRVLRLLLPCLLALGFAATAAATPPPPSAPSDTPLLRRAPTALETRLQAVSSTIARRPVRLRCGSTGDPQVGGFVRSLGSHPLDYSIIATKECDSLGRLQTMPDEAVAHGCFATQVLPESCMFAAAQAIGAETIAHEASHLAGILNEARAECYGLQNTWYVASKLGASTAVAQALAHWYWQVVYPTKKGTIYWTSECRSGGKLDLRPNTPGWPS